MKEMQCRVNHKDQKALTNITEQSRLHCIMDYSDGVLSENVKRMTIKVPIYEVWIEKRVSCLCHAVLLMDKSVVRYCSSR